MSVVELRGVNHSNKGAELMLVAISRHLAAAGVTAAMPFRESTFRNRRASGVGHLIYLEEQRFPGMDALLDHSVELVPRMIRRRLGIYSSQEPTAALDASGFRYSEQWGLDEIRRTVRRIHTLAQNGRPYIFLPQAFGPFSQPEYKKYVEDMVQGSRLVFARDKVSLAALQEIVGHVGHLKLAPDFTNLVSVANVQGVELPPKTLLIVPNSRMLDKVGAGNAELYMPIMLKIAAVAVQNGLLPVVLVHDASEDARLADSMRQLSDNNMLVISDQDPIRLKAYLSKAYAVVSSRFHAIVGALSSGVPTLAIGWSHKYKEIMDDYACGEYCASMSNPDYITDVIKAWSDVSQRDVVADGLSRAALHQKERALQMWREVDEILKAVE